MPWYLWLSFSLVVYFICGLVNARVHSVEALRTSKQRYFTGVYQRHSYLARLVGYFLLWPYHWFLRPPVRLVWKSVSGFIEAPIRQHEREIEALEEATRFWKKEYDRMARDDSSRQMAYELWNLNLEKLSRLKGN